MPARTEQKPGPQRSGLTSGGAGRLFLWLLFRHPLGIAAVRLGLRILRPLLRLVAFLHVGLRVVDHLISPPTVVIRKPASSSTITSGRRATQTFDRLSGDFPRDPVEKASVRLFAGKEGGKQMSDRIGSAASAPWRVSFFGPILKFLLVAGVPLGPLVSLRGLLVGDRHYSACISARSRAQSSAATKHSGGAGEIRTRERGTPVTAFPVPR